MGRDRPIRILFALTIVVLLIAGAVGSQRLAVQAEPPHHGSAQAGQVDAVVKILNDRVLWGKDYAMALAYLDSWNQIGERQVAIFADRVVGTTSYRTQAAAEDPLARLNAAVHKPQPSPTQAFAALLDAVRRGGKFTLRTAVAPLVPDGGFRLTWNGTTAQFLAPRLTIDVVRKQLGAPEQVTRVALDNEREDRPVVLTLYHYAQGAISFAESDWGPRPSVIDRVILDLPAVTSVIFQKQ